MTHLKSRTRLASVATSTLTGSMAMLGQASAAFAASLEDFWRQEQDRQRREITERLNGRGEAPRLNRQQRRAAARRRR